ncbi:MAG: VanZ family protein [Candidatus Hydrogenedentes bacterium]|nr:VanZ family protein [Candidatus Hydrogenedentota bacterium]
MQRAYYAAILCYCGLIFWISSRPVPELSGPKFPGQDKLLHLMAYGVLAGLVSLGLHRSGRAYAPRLLYWIPVLVSALYGVSDEIHQYFVPDRTFSFGDMAANLTGALLASAVCLLFFRRFPRLIPAEAEGT